MKAIIIGQGKMGKLIAETLESKGHEVLAMGDLMHPEAVEAALTDADVILDFSHHDNLDWILPGAVKNHVPLVEGTTALTEKQMEEMEEASRTLPVFYSANYSLGIAVLKKLAAAASSILKDKWDIEIIEKHHNQKADAPSGTALMLLDAVDPENEFDHVFGRNQSSGKRGHEIGIHAIRGGSLAGCHEIELEGPDESITIAHNANSRQIFVNGAIDAAEFLVKQPDGFYTMEDLVA